LDQDEPAVVPAMLNKPVTTGSDLLRRDVQDNIAWFGDDQACLKFDDVLVRDHRQ